MKKSNLLSLLFGILLGLSIYFIVILSNHWIETKSLETKIMGIFILLIASLILFFVGKEIFIYSFHFNNRHPEKLSDEVFCCNIHYNDPEGLSGIGWKEKRSGKRAYNTYGEPLLECYPVFIKRNEVKKRIVEDCKIELNVRPLKKMLR